MHILIFERNDFMEILKLTPACKDYLWGGDKLKKFFNKKTYSLASNSNYV